MTLGVFRPLAMGGADGALVNRLLITACLILSLMGVSPEKLAFMPAFLFGLAPGDPPVSVAAGVIGLFGHMWVHADPIHLLTNVAALALFGGPVERRLGSPRHLLLFLIAALVGALLDGWLSHDRMVAMLGASGGICGVMAAAVVVAPRGRVASPVVAGRALSMPWSWLVVFSALGDVALGVVNNLEVAPLIDGDSVAWVAHLAGMGVGVALGLAWYPRIDVFDGPIVARIGWGYVAARSPRGMANNALTAIAWALVAAVIWRA